ncbi:hypothetical protein CHH83_20915 [Bacillus sp. 7586-K]|nr:hypothetical protein CHH83_20915 [Bacillus sp. 7586-K]
MADGKIVIDTSIDQKGIQEGLKTISKNVSSSAKDMEKISDAVANQGKTRAKAFSNFTDAMQDSLKGVRAEHEKLNKSLQNTPEYKEYRALNNELKLMELQMKTTNMKALLPFQKQMLQTRKGMFELASSMGEYSGTTKQFMGDVKQLGAEYKKANDEMIKANKMLGASIIQTAGTMMNMTTQAQRISDNYDRMQNPIYKVNKAGLAVADTMNKIANNGNAAVLALKLLGPNANMKQLRDMQMMINQGLMRFQAVALSAATASAILYTSLFKVAKGPDPSEVYQKQADALAHYAEELDKRTNEIANAWNLFEDIQLKSVSSDALTKNLNEQVNELRNWKDNLADIAEHAGEEFAQYLADMGPQAAGEVATIAKMTGPQLDKYVALWKEKMALAREQATTELEGLKAETDKKVKELQDSLTPLGLALEPLKQVWAEAFKPMVDAFTMVSVPIVNFLTLIGEMIVKFNEAHPTLALIIQGIMMLIPILTLLLAPLAIGIGLFGGLQAAMSFVWMIIGPLVTGLAAMTGTVLLVAAAIVGLVAGIMYLWNNTSWFKDMVLSAWNVILETTKTVWDFILNSILKPIFTAIVSFGKSILDQFVGFWKDNGTEIMSFVRAFMTTCQTLIKGGMEYIKGVFQVVWPIISGIVKVAWAIIQSIVSTAISLVLGVISATMKLLSGDWEGAWESIKNTAQTIWENIVGFFEGIDLYEIGANIIQGLIDGIGSMVDSVKDTVGGIVSDIQSAITGPFQIHSPSRWTRDFIAGNLGKGFTIGIDREETPIVRKVKEMTSWMTPSMPDLSGLTPAFSSVSINNDSKVARHTETGQNGVLSILENLPQILLQIPLNGRVIAEETVDISSELMNQRLIGNRRRV